MKFDMQHAPEMVCPSEVAVGDIYPAKGGRGEVTVWLVLSVRHQYAHCVGLNVNGEITGTTTYGVWAFRERGRIGFCQDVANLGAFTIEWFGCHRGSRRAGEAPV